MYQILNTNALTRRASWLNTLKSASGQFNNQSSYILKQLSQECSLDGVSALLDHLRMCGTIPECFSHDSSEEKLYSKYTDAVLAESFTSIGMTSIVLDARGDSADVETFAKQYSFVSDAKSFRITRTAKNAKDFKIQAMDGWKRGKPYAVVVCPINQLPSIRSQIYEQAVARNVCIFSYSHLAVLLQFAQIEGNDRAEDLLHTIFSVNSMNIPNQSAASYWIPINRAMLSYSPLIDDIWAYEKVAVSESVHAAKEEALTIIAQERERIVRMNHIDAINELLNINSIDSRIRTVQLMRENSLFMIR